MWLSNFWQVDSFDMSINEAKLEALSSLKFSQILQQLKSYLELAEWFRSYIHQYFQIIKFLEEQKRLLMKSDSKTDRARKVFLKTVQIFLSLSTEFKVFNSLQKIFNNLLFFFYQNSICRLFIDFNAVKTETKFEAIIYHVKSKLKYFKNSKKMTLLFYIQIQSILFLSRWLNQHKKHYWSTKLEITCLIWILQKIWHMIEAAKQATII